jgi:hypothetical protein
MPTLFVQLAGGWKWISWSHYFGAAFIAWSCGSAFAVEAEPVSVVAKTSLTAGSVPNELNSAPKSKLQWRPARGSSNQISPPVRTVRYEEDVFQDGPSLGGKPALMAAPAQYNQNQPSGELKSPFDEPTTTTPSPAIPAPATPNSAPPATETTTPESRPLDSLRQPMDGAPPLDSFRQPREAQPPVEFRDPAARQPDLSPMPTTPAERTPPTRDPFGRPIMPEVPSRPEVDRQPPTQFQTFDEMRRNRPVRSPAEDCETAYNKLKENTIDKLSIDIKVAGERGNDVPFECMLSDDPFDPRCWKLTTYTWKASCLCHKPIYFEEEALERYGHSHGPGCEYLVSFAHFFGNVILLPYHMGVETPTECVYTLGVYRAGSCAPYIIDPFPISLRGAAFGAVGYCGTVALFP